MSEICPLTSPCACATAARHTTAADATTTRAARLQARPSELKAKPEVELTDAPRRARVVPGRDATPLETDEEGLRGPPEHVRRTHRVARADGAIGEVDHVEPAARAAEQRGEELRVELPPACLVVD